jgi:hypothetical protein
MPHLKYPAYLAVVCAVLLDLYSAKPETSVAVRLALDGLAVIFASVGLGCLVVGHWRPRRA